MNDLFEGMEGLESIPKFHDKHYTCRICKSHNTVSWVEETQNFVCSNCGRVDAQKTDEYKKEMAGVIYEGCLHLYSKSDERLFPGYGKVQRNEKGETRVTFRANTILSDEFFNTPFIIRAFKDYEKKEDSKVTMKGELISISDMKLGDCHIEYIFLLQEIKVNG